MTLYLRLNSLLHNLELKQNDYDKIKIKNLPMILNFNRMFNILTQQE